MRAVIQRVMNASVTVDGEIISSIGKGLCVLIGIARDDADSDIDFIVKKVLNLRIFENGDGRRWDKCVTDYGFEILCVSQDYHLAMAPDIAPAFYEKFLQKLKSSYKSELVADGKFGAYMQVNIQNDGPVTLTIDSRKPVSDSS